MSYATAVQAEKPHIAELYQITKIDSTVEYYTSWYRNVDYDSNTYLSIAVIREPVRYQTGIRVGKLSARIPVDSSYVTIADVVGKHTYDGAEIFLTQIDMTNDANKRCLFRGTVSVIDIIEHAMNVNFENVMSKLKATLPLRAYSQQCTHRYGDSVCTADLSSLKTSGTTDAGSTDEVIVDSILTDADNYWRYGYIHITSGTYSGEKRTVISSNQSSTNVTVEVPFSGTIGAGITYDLYPYCQKKLSLCFTDNYLGFWFIKKVENIYYG